MTSAGRSASGAIVAAKERVKVRTASRIGLRPRDTSERQNRSLFATIRVRKRKVKRWIASPTMKAATMTPILTSQFGSQAV